MIAISKSLSRSIHLYVAFTSHSSFPSVYTAFVHVVCFALQHLPYKPGNPAFEFVVRPYGSTRVTFESRKFVGCFLSVDQSGAVSVRYLSPDSEEVQFAVRVQVGMCTSKMNGYIVHLALLTCTPSIP